MESSDSPSILLPAPILKLALDVKEGLQQLNLLPTESHPETDILLVLNYSLNAALQFVNQSISLSRATQMVALERNVSQSRRHDQLMAVLAERGEQQVVQQPLNPTQQLPWSRDAAEAGIFQDVAALRAFNHNFAIEDHPNQRLLAQQQMMAKHMKQLAELERRRESAGLLEGSSPPLTEADQPNIKRRRSETLPRRRQPGTSSQSESPASRTKAEPHLNCSSGEDSHVTSESQREGQQESSQATGVLVETTEQERRFVVTINRGVATRLRQPRDQQDIDSLPDSSNCSTLCKGACGILDAEPTGIYRCPFCPYSSPISCDVLMHVRGHAHHDYYRCSLCGFSTAHLARFESHKESQHKGSAVRNFLQVVPVEQLAVFFPRSKRPSLVGSETAVEEVAEADRTGVTFVPG